MQNRKRNQVIKICMTDEELKKFKLRLKESGKKTKQAYGLEALLESKIISQEVVTNLTELNKTLVKQQLNERNIGTNINQIAKIANATGELDVSKLEDYLLELKYMGLERERIWLLLRSYLAALQRRV